MAEVKQSEGDAVQIEDKLHSLAIGDERDDAPISKLNDDCLREILSYLTKRQLIGTERVCKKWQEISWSLWSSLNYKQLKEISLHKGKGTMKTLEKILKRHGKNLRSLNIFRLDLASPETNADKIAVLICKYCKNLRSLKISGEFVTLKGFELMEKDIFPNLEAFKINKCSIFNGATDKVFERFMEKAPKLKSLSINGNKNISGDCLLSLKKSFKRLEVLDCDYLVIHPSDEDFVIKVLRNSPELEVLKIHDPMVHLIPYFNILGGLPLRTHLVKFELHHGGFFREITETALPFPNLQSLCLKIDHRSVNNEVLARFHKLFPKLKKFAFSEFNVSVDSDEYDDGGLFDDFDDEEFRLEDQRFLDEIDDGKTRDENGIKELAKCSHLKSLKFFNLPWLTGDSLVYLTASGKFEVLGCANTDKIRDAEIIKVVSSSPRLRYLDVFNCKKLTNKFLIEVVKLMDQRINKTPLKINITNYKRCDYTLFENKHPLLTFESNMDSCRW